MKRAYSMVVSQEQQAMKFLNYSNKNYMGLPINFHEMYPNLESRDLRHNQLQENSYSSLENLITQAASLKFLDISNNPLSSYFLISLHDIADQRINLVSDYSLWVEAHPGENFPKIKWTLSPEQWGRESICLRLFDDIARYWVDEPETHPEFIAALTPILHQKNLLGWTPLICMVLISTPKLANTLIDQLGIENFTQTLIAHCQDSAVIDLFPEKWVPGVVYHSFLIHAKKPELAFRLVQSLLPEEGGARYEALGNIALFEKNYAEAYQCYSAGASLGWVHCHYELAMMILNQYAPDVLPFNYQDYCRHLIIAADAGDVYAQLKLAQDYEQEGDLFNACYYYEQARNIINEFPNMVHGLVPKVLHQYRQRIRFVEGISDLINTVLIARVDLAKERALQLPAFHHFNKKVVYNELHRIFGPYTLEQIIKTVGISLLHHHIHNENILGEFITKARIFVNKNPVPNRNFLSCDLDIFAQTLIQFLKEELALRFGCNMRTSSEGVVNFTKFK